MGRHATMIHSRNACIQTGMFNGPEVQTLQTSEVEFAYREFGKLDGTPFLFVHGFPDSSTAFDDLIARINPAKRGLRFIVPDQRGYGGTLVRNDNLISGEVAAMATDLLALANGLRLPRFAIVGHDWGARAGYAACVLEPKRVRGLFALSSLYINRTQPEPPPPQVQAYWYQWYFQTAQGEHALTQSAEALCQHIWKAWSPHWDFSRSEFRQAAKAWKNPQFSRTVLHAYRHVWGNVLGRPAYAAAQAELDAAPRPKISVPTLFAYGDDDHCVLPESSVSQPLGFSGPYERIAIHGSGHFPHREDPKAVAKLFDRFLKMLPRA